MIWPARRTGSASGASTTAASPLASQIATALENARLYGRVVANEKRFEEDLATAREIQRGLEPGDAAAQHQRGRGLFSLCNICGPFTCNQPEMPRQTCQHGSWRFTGT